MANSPPVSMGVASPAQAIDQLQQQDRLRSAPMPGRIQGADQVETRGAKAKRDREENSAEKRASDRHIARADRFTNAKLARMALETAIKAVQERRVEVNQEIARTNAQTSAVTQSQEQELAQQTKEKASALVAARRPHPATPEETTRKAMLEGREQAPNSPGQSSGGATPASSTLRGNRQPSAHSETGGFNQADSRNTPSSARSPEEPHPAEASDAAARQQLERIQASRRAQQQLLEKVRATNSEPEAASTTPPGRAEDQHQQKTASTETRTARPRRPAEAVAIAQEQERRATALTDTEVELAMQGTAPRIRSTSSTSRTTSLRRTQQDDTAPPQTNHETSTYAVQFTATPPTTTRAQPPSSPREFLLQLTATSTSTTSDEEAIAARSPEEQLAVDAEAIDHLQTSVVNAVQVTREVLQTRPSANAPDQLQAHATTLDRLDTALREQHTALAAIEARYQGEGHSEEVQAGRGRVTISAHQAESLAASIAKQIDAQSGQTHAPIQPMAVIQLLS